MSEDAVISKTRPSTNDIGLLPVERRELASVELTRQLLDYLLSGRFGIGDRIPSERQLAIALSVGRSAVRDALRPLAALGLLDIRIGDGTYLNDPDTDLLPKLIEWGMLLNERAVLDLIEARLQFELVTARFAAERRDDKALQELRDILAAMAVAETVEIYSQLDTEFHLRIADASGNAVLAGLLHRIESLLRVWIHRVMSTGRERSTSFEEHVPILRAIEAGDPDAAAAAMHAHLSGATARLRATLEQ
jgi:GntR family transcriptional regulator, transcriptional repressor for pyruvate dehydrogenase complex